eukprot:scaffold62507_cov16-Tisochrysis_lutea.AAC.3
MPPFSSRELKRLLTGESHNAARQVRHRVKSLKHGMTQLGGSLKATSLENEKALEQPSNLSPDVQPARLTLQERQDRQLIAAMAPLLGGYEFRDAALLREHTRPPCVHSSKAKLHKSGQGGYAPSIPRQHMFRHVIVLHMHHKRNCKWSMQILTNPRASALALTHCSCPHPPCNQRLEFLGDAAIEMLAVCHLLANPQSRICPPE